MAAMFEDRADLSDEEYAEYYAEHLGDLRRDTNED